MIEEIRSFFNEHYSYINHQAISDKVILAQMNQPYMKSRSFESQMDLLRDWMLAGDLCEVVE